MSIKDGYIFIEKLFFVTKPRLQERIDNCSLKNFDLKLKTNSGYRLRLFSGKKC